MSTSRVNPEAGWVDGRKLERGTNGRPLCRRCRVEVPKGRRTFCSNDCVHEWKLRTQPDYLRIETFKRDRGVCAICGCDTEQLRRILGAFERETESRWSYGDDNGKRPFRSVGWPEVYALYRALSFVPRRSLWDADHIVPVVEGGGECGLDNIRTLCVPCHKDVTRELARRRAEARRSPEPPTMFNGGDV
jgi:5-methylcytosine-specific restriction enzyme A